MFLVFLSLLLMCLNMILIDFFSAKLTKSSCVSNLPSTLSALHNHLRLTQYIIVLLSTIIKIYHENMIKSIVLISTIEVVLCILNACVIYGRIMI